MKLSTGQWVAVGAGALALLAAWAARDRAAGAAAQVGQALSPARGAASDFLAWYTGLAAYESAVMAGRAPDLDGDGEPDTFQADWWPWW